MTIPATARPPATQAVATRGHGRSAIRTAPSGGLPVEIGMAPRTGTRPAGRAGTGDRVLVRIRRALRGGFLVRIVTAPRMTQSAGRAGTGDCGLVRIRRALSGGLLVEIGMVSCVATRPAGSVGTGARIRTARSSGLPVAIVMVHRDF